MLSKETSLPLRRPPFSLTGQPAAGVVICRYSETALVCTGGGGGGHLPRFGSETAVVATSDVLVRGCRFQWSVLPLLGLYNL